MPIRLRKKFLQALAQAQSDTPSEAIDPDKTVKLKTEQDIGTPPSFIPSNLYPTLRKAFAPDAVLIIDQLSQLLNECIFYSANGDLDMVKLFQVNFNYSPTIASKSRDLQFLISFAKEVYSKLYNNANPYNDSLKESEFKEKVNSLLQSPSINSLTQANPNSILGKKLGTNIKSKFLEYFKSLLNIKPTK